MLDTEAPGTVPNPYALPGVAGDAAAALASTGLVFYGGAAIIGIAALVARTRRSHGVERQQLKWFAYVGVLLLASLVVAAISLIGHDLYVVGVIGWTSFLALVTFGLPLAIGAAILRHRLYDIDVVINRTLVYGALTATLGAHLPRARAADRADARHVEPRHRGLDAGGRGAVPPGAGAHPGAVDRRFYRRRYDAARTLEAFGGRLRDELDLDAVQRELRGVIAETVQPAHVSLWLRSER